MRSTTKLRKVSLVNLAKGLVNDEFLYYYQPIVSLETGYVIGAECLLRWVDASGAMRLPAEFIPIAEETSFIGEIDRAMVVKLGERLRDLNQLNERFFLTINISQGDLESESFADDLSQHLNANGVKREHLRLEITERVVYPGNEQTKTTINRLSELGFTLLLDDFGVGNSSVEYLTRMPIMAIKLDGELISRGHAHIGEFKIIRHLIGLGHQLGMYIIAEGVEDEETLSLLASKGCTEVQGYLLAKPMPFEELLELVKKNERLWTGYPFGLDYLAQFDHIDVRRDLVREVLILHHNSDESLRQRALNRIPNLDPKDCLFGHWYYGAGRLHARNVEDYSKLGKHHEAFHAICQKLLQAALADKPLNEIKAIIEEMSEESRQVLSLAQKISTQGLLDHFVE